MTLCSYGIPEDGGFLSERVLSSNGGRTKGGEFGAEIDMKAELTKIV